VVDFGGWIPHCSLVPDDPRSLLLSTRLSHAVKWSGSTRSAAESAATTSTAGTRKHSLFPGCWSAVQLLCPVREGPRSVKRKSLTRRRTVPCANGT
jgi:hypothetical protein